MKTVIVVISTYNGAKYIERQLNSIFEQSGVDIQVLVRDDCSKDNTVKVVREYAKNHPQNKIEIIKGENVGFAKSFGLVFRCAAMQITMHLQTRMMFGNRIS